MLGGEEFAAQIFRVRRVIIHNQNVGGVFCLQHIRCFFQRFRELANQIDVVTAEDSMLNEAVDRVDGATLQACYIVLQRKSRPLDFAKVFLELRRMLRAC